MVHPGVSQKGGDDHFGHRTISIDRYRMVCQSDPGEAARKLEVNRAGEVEQLTRSEPFGPSSEAAPHPYCIRTFRPFRFIQPSIPIQPLLEGFTMESIARRD